MKKYLLASLVLLAGCGGGGGSGAPETPATNNSVTPAVTAAKTFDPGGHWKIESQNCKGEQFTEGDFIDGSKVGDLQHFTTSGGFEGFLNVNTKAFYMCFIGTLSSCMDACLGQIDDNYKADLICDDLAGGECDVVTQKS